MTIYTRTGDGGETGLLGGLRVGKDAARVEAFGAIDELNCVLGLVRAEPLPQPVDRLLERVQQELFDLGAELAAPDPAARPAPAIGQEHVAALEADLDRLDARLPPLARFVLPTGSRAGAALHVARAVCRRAERRTVALRRLGQGPVSPAILAYLNRLGDLLFVLARTVNLQAGHPDLPWRAAP
jgi:cob(I)alamin adenosyltransferase